MKKSFITTKIQMNGFAVKVIKQYPENIQKGKVGNKHINIALKKKDAETVAEELNV